QKRIIGYQKILVHYPNAQDIKDLLEKEQQQLNNLLTDYSNKWQIHSRANWIEKGEKSTKYFYSRFIQRTAASASILVKDPDTPTPSSQIQTLNYIGQWYQNLYTLESSSIFNTDILLANVMPFPPTETSSLMDL